MTAKIVVINRNTVLAVIDENGVERATYKLGYGTRLTVKDGENISRGDKMFEWDPYSLPIIADKGWRC